MKINVATKRAGAYKGLDEEKKSLFIASMNVA